MSDGFMPKSRPGEETAAQRFVKLFGAFGHGEPGEAEALAQLYAEGAVFEDPYQRIVGRPAIEEAFRAFLGIAKSLRIDVLRSLTSDHEVFLTWRIRLRPRLGPAIVMEGATYARLEAGKVVLHRDYWDTVETLGLTAPVLPRALRTLGRLVRRG